MKDQSNAAISRRRFLGTAGILATGALLSPKRLFAQEESPVIGIINAAKTATITTTKLRGNLSVLEGSGGNITVLAGKDGILLVDAGISGSKTQLLKAIHDINDAPLRYLINTHWHFDHTDGNAWVHQQGATIIAHENTRKHMSETVRIEEWKYTFTPSPKEALPSVKIKQAYKLPFNGETIMLQHFAPAHTDGDLSVYFPDADVLHVADIFWNGHYPFIDYNTGGNINGIIAATKATLERAGSKTIIIPGHGPVADREKLNEYYELLETSKENISKLKKQGKSLAEAIAAKPTAKYDVKWGTFLIGPEAFTALVYRGV